MRCAERMHPAIYVMEGSRFGGKKEDLFQVLDYIICFDVRLFWLPQTGEHSAKTIQACFQVFDNIFCNIVRLGQGYPSPSGFCP